MHPPDLSVVVLFMSWVCKVYRFSCIASRGVTCMVPYRGEGDEVRHLKQSGDVGKVNVIPFHPRDEQSIRDCIGNSDIVLNLVGKYYQTKNLYLKKNYTYVSAFVLTGCMHSCLVSRM